MSPTTQEINGALIYILTFSILLFFLIVFFMILFLVRYRAKRHPQAVEIKSGGLIEAAWIGAAVLVALSMFVYGLTGFSFLRAAPADSLPITVHSRQWSWLFVYPDGKSRPDLVVPVNRNVRCDLVSDDVIHGFYVPDFRVQQDAVPGLTTRVWFRGTEVGTHDILCTQYCGLNHALMRARLAVVSEDQYETWLKGKEIEFPNAAPPSSMPAGERIVREQGCLSCHSLDGGPMSGPTFKGLYGKQVDVLTGGKERSVLANDDYCRKSIEDPGADVVEGYPNIMPTYKDVLTPKSSAAVVEYLQSMK